MAKITITTCDVCAEQIKQLSTRLMVTVSLTDDEGRFVVKADREVCGAECAHTVLRQAMDELRANNKEAVASAVPLAPGPVTGSR